MEDSYGRTLPGHMALTEEGEGLETSKLQGKDMVAFQGEGEEVCLCVCY